MSYSSIESFFFAGLASAVAGAGTILVGLWRAIVLKKGKTLFVGCFVACLGALVTYIATREIIAIT